MNTRIPPNRSAMSYLLSHRLLGGRIMYPQQTQSPASPASSTIYRRAVRDSVRISIPSAYATI
jgi:hypothetical protein